VVLRQFLSIFERPAAASVFVVTLGGCTSAQTHSVLSRTAEVARARLSAPERLTVRAEDAEEVLTSPLQRDTVIALALIRSPALAMMAHRARALVHGGRAEGALPAAEIGFEAWNLPLARPYTLGEADMYMLELRQRFPAAGSLDARARAAAEEAQAMLAELSTEERLVAERVADAFAAYAQAVAAERIQKQQIALLERMLQAVHARHASGDAHLADSARVELELSRAHRVLARIDGELRSAHAVLNALLRRPPAAPLGEPRALPAETVQLTVEQLLGRAETVRGAVLSADARVRAAAARREAARAEARVPEFMVGLGYWQAPKMRAGFGVTASMSLPWLSGPSQDRLHQADAEVAAGHAARDNASQQAQAEIAETLARLHALERELRVVGSQSLPAAHREVDAHAAAFTSGRVSLLEWLDAARSMLDTELELVFLRSELGRTVASLERAVGTALPKQPFLEDTGL